MVKMPPTHAEANPSMLFMTERKARPARTIPATMVMEYRFDVFISVFLSSSF
jgi:hypothetical protein